MGMKDRVWFHAFFFLIPIPRFPGIKMKGECPLYRLDEDSVVTPTSFTPTSFRLFHFPAPTLSLSDSRIYDLASL